MPFMANTITILGCNKNNTIMKAFIARDSDGGLYLYYSNPPIKAELHWISLRVLRLRG